MSESSTAEKSPKKVSLIKDISLTTLGVDLALPIFGGVLFGYRLDQASTTNYVYTLLFLLLGLIIGYYNVFKLIQLELFRLKLNDINSREKRS